ncbi:phage holin family protein [Nocardioides daejeonensis]|uniref:phage holin family protein n=1 Tax=Nocardioides daejeonensis TaxID=1046556 RepID=UPI000D74887D|nr:phage holin family protein [Nocardioides daejeonensis]
MSAKTTTTASDPSTGELLAAFSEQAGELVRQELRLAQAEMKQKGRGLGAGIGMLGGSGALAVYGIGVLLAAAVLGLATAMPGWLAALIVGAVLLAVAGIAALIGKSRITEAVPPTPERTISNVQEDVATLRRQQ